MPTTEGPSNLQSWPNYEAAYLAKRLGHDKPTDAYKNRYEYGTGDANTLNMGGQFDDPIARQVYLERVTKDFRED